MTDRDIIDAHDAGRDRDLDEAARYPWLGFKGICLGFDNFLTTLLYPIFPGLSCMLGCLNMHSSFTHLNCVLPTFKDFCGMLSFKGMRLSFSSFSCTLTSFDCLSIMLPSFSLYMCTLLISCTYSGLLASLDPISCMVQEFFRRSCFRLCGRWLRVDRIHNQSPRRLQP